MAKGNNDKTGRNPFDEQSQNKLKKEKKVVEKFDFESLSYEDKVKYVKENFESGLNGKQLDFYNKEILQEEPVAGRSSKYTKAQKPTKQETPITDTKPKNEIKDLSELANIKIEEVIDPEQEEIAVAKAIETGEAQVEEIVSEIEADKEKGEAKAEILGGKEGQESLAKALEPIEDEKKDIVGKTQKAKRTYPKKNPKTNPETNNQDQKLSEVKEQPNIALISEQLDKATKAIEELKEGGKKDAEELAKLQEEEAKDSNKTEGEATITKKEILAKVNRLESKQDALKAELDEKIAENEKLEGNDEQEEEKLKPLSLEDDKEFEDENEEALEEITQNQKTKKEGFLSGAKEGVKNSFTKSVDYWNNLDNKRGGKIAKTVISAGIIGASIFGIGELSGLNNPTNSINKIWIRSGLAGTISSLMTWNVTQKAINNLKEGWKNSSNLTKAGVVLVGAGAGAGLALSFLGASTIAITGAAIGTKLYANRKYDKKIEKINFDINALVGNLDEIEKEREKLNEKLRKTKLYKNLTNGLISILSGLGSMAANQIEFKLRENFSNNINNPGIGNTQDVVNQTQPEEIPKAVATDTKTENLDQDIKEITVEENKSQSWSDKAKNLWKNLWNKNNEKPEGLVKSNEKNILEEANDKLKNAKTKLNDKVEELMKGKTPEEHPYTAKEAIVDGKERPGITYAYRDQLRANNDLAQKFAKYKGLDLSKLNDDDYMAKYTKDIAIKLGNMDKAGHEIRLSEKAIDKMAYVLDLDSNNNITSEETNVSTGKVEETRFEGNSFEASSIEKEYETYSDKKYGYSPKVNLSPENDPAYSGEVTYTQTTPDADPVEQSTDSLTKKDIEDSKIKPDNIEKYDYKNIEKSPEWVDNKNNNFLKFLSGKNSSYTTEKNKIFDYLKKDYAEAVKKDPNLTDYIVANKDNITIAKAKILFDKINHEGYKTEPDGPNLPGNKEDLIIPDNLKNDPEFIKLSTIAEKDGYKLTEDMFKNIEKTKTESLKAIFGKDIAKFEEEKNLAVGAYETKYDDDLRKYLKILKEKTGLTPKTDVVVDRGEKVEDFINRALWYGENKGISKELMFVREKVSNTEYDNKHYDYQNNKTIKN